MKKLAMALGLLALAGTIVPAALFMIQSITAGQGAAPDVSLDTVKRVMLVSTVVWFAAAPFWMSVE